MFLRVSAPGLDLDQSDIDQIEKDLEKLDRRLHEYQEVSTEVRIKGTNGKVAFHVVLEVEFSRNHLVAKADNNDMGVAVRESREEILRQINDRSRRGHSSFSKGR